MRHIRLLMLTKHRRKKHIIGLFVILILLGLIIPFVKSISLGQGNIVNQSIQHFVIELIGISFLIYFGGVSLHELYDNKTIQLLRAKKKKPLELLGGLWLSLYTIYAVFVLVAGGLFSIYYLGQADIFLTYVNLLFSGATILSIVFFLSLFANAYASLLFSFAFYIISYSINYILFSVPVGSQDSLSSNILYVVQYIFPRFDILYSYSGSQRLWGAGANLLYFLVVTTIMVIVFLRHSR